MRPLFEVIGKVFSRTKPCLILGKGESYSKVQITNLSEYQTIGLNHTVEIQSVDFAHCIDLDVLSTRFVQNCKYAILPYHPHIDFKVTNKSLPELIKENCYLEELDSLGKLLWYNCSTYKGFPQNPAFPLIEARLFSSEAIFNILAHAGVKVFHTLGIDGGYNYAPEFQHLKPLSNGRESFTEQFPRLKKICREFSIDWIQL
jgi:hypothetical protein